MTALRLPRAHLVSRLRDAAGFACLVAAAGYGKTALLRAWDAADPRPFVWLSPARPGSAAEQLRDPYAPEGRHPDAAADLVGMLGRAAEPVVLVLDDLHLAARGTWAADLAAIAAADLAPDTRVVLAARHLDPRLMTRLRLRGGTVELGERELAFDRGEIARLLAEAGGDAGTPDEEASAALERRTEGWPAAIRLAIGAGYGTGAAARDLDGRDRVFDDFVASEILDGIDAPMRTFVEGCAPFTEIDAALCDSVLRRTDSQRMLERGESEHLLLFARDRERRTFRLHPLLRETVLARAERADPARVGELRARGARWLRDRGDAVRALPLLLANGERRAALGLLADVALPLFSAGRLTELVGLIRGIGEDIAVHDVALATMLASAAAMTGDAVCARRWERTARAQASRHGFPGLDAEAGYLTLRAHLAPDGVAGMTRDAERARRLVDDGGPWRVPVLLVCGMAARLRDDTAAAARDLDECLHLARESGARPAAILVLAELAVQAERAGLPVRARAAIAECTALGDESLRAYPHAAVSLAVRAALAARDGRRDEARGLFDAASGRLPLVGAALPWMGVRMRLALARAGTALGETEAADALLRECDDLLRALGGAPALEREATELAGALQRLPPQRTGASLLTPAERRLLPLLPTRLTFEEIGGRFHLSKNTIKTQAMSLYRKLGVSSRTDAVRHADSLGLVVPVSRGAQDSM